MRSFFIAIFCFLGSAAFAQSSSEEITLSIDHLLDSFVENGKVDYKTLVSVKSNLDKLVEQIGRFPLSSVDANEEKAFLINAYNIFVIKQVVDNYPIASPQEKGNFFTEKRFDLSNSKKLSLNDLEKNILLRKYPDARLHFALVCAAEGCPKLRSEAYTSASLEEQLEEQSRLALQNPYFLDYDDTSNSLNISKLFDWYATDFGGNKQERIEFINRYASKKVPMDTKFEYNEYDWTLNGKDAQVGNAPEKEMSNLQLFTPSALFTRGEFEVNVFNSIYSQQSFRDEEGNEDDLGETQNFFTSMIMLTTGVSEKTRFNVGLDVFISKARYSPEDVSALNVFSNSDDATFNETVVSYIAPRIKWVPFKTVPRLSIQSALWIPVSDQLEEERFIAHDRYTWFTQVFFDKNLGDDFQIFLEADLLYRFENSELHNYDFFRTPVSVFLSYFPTSNSTIYVFSQYSPRFETTMEIDDSVEMEIVEEFGMTSWFAQFGIGGKYQITDALGIELSYSNFALSRSEGAGHTLNFGLRYIHR
ncbi:DUF547 domain-containing protein [Cryomorphaceae bacterium 1068]|nr:DUF547 domain-containing protein [Cryomorphaceae bacterium 1068]